MPRLVAVLVVLSASAASIGSRFPMDLNYLPNNTQIEITNSGRHFNRPLYGASNGLVVLAGDRPLVKSVCSGMFQGTLMVALRRGASCGGWAHLDPAATTVAGYRPGVSSWRHTSPLLPGAVLNMTAVPTDGGKGLAVRVDVTGVNAGDELLWMFGAVSTGYNPSTSDPCVVSGAHGPRTDQLLDDRGNIQLMQTGFIGTQAAGNIANALASRFNLSHNADAKSFAVRGVTSATGPGAVKVVRFDSKSSSWQNTSLMLPVVPSSLTAALTGDAEAVGGVISLATEPEVFFSFEPDPSPERLAETPEQTFIAAIARVERIRTHVVVETPDSFMNAGIPCAAAAVDGLWRDSPPVYVHGAMAWDVALLGWRSEYGGTVWGQPERVAAEGVYWLGRQLKADPPGHNRSVCKADPRKHLAAQDPESRFNGVGSINSVHYDMQSQMFEQQVHMWRWTANGSHERMLRPGLELHAAWAHDSFDADSNGLYHSYINTWPTDAVYYNGGESVEETAYMLSTHSALMDMARQAGDTATAEKHKAIADKIRRNFFVDGAGLWMNQTGHPAAWREEVGNRRLRPDPWSYSVFLAVDAKLVTGLEAAQALHFTECGLQRLHDV